MRTIKIGLLGAGTVGGGVISVLDKNRDEIEHRVGARLTITHIACRNQKRLDKLPIGDAQLMQDPMQVADADVDIVVELLGGEEPALSCIRQAITKKHSVVTANKAVLARHGNQILTMARHNAVSILYEAAVAGGIPIMQVLRDSLAANHIESVVGIINGTCNYILTEMRVKSMENQVALKQAQMAGYAEADPLADIGGDDAGHKLALLAAAAFGTPVMHERVYVEGITHICLADVRCVEDWGYRIRHAGVARHATGANEFMELRAHPVLVSNQHPLFSVDGVDNAIAVSGNAVGTTFYRGAGAGGEPTASAVLADVMTIARCLALNTTPPAPTTPWHDADADTIPNVLPIDDMSTPFYLRLTTATPNDAEETIKHVLDEYDINLTEPIKRMPISAGADTGDRKNDNDASVLAFMTNQITEQQAAAALRMISEKTKVISVAHIPVENII